MAEATAEPQTAAVEKPSQAANGSTDKAIEVDTNSKAGNGDKHADDEDNFERYDKNSRDERDGREHKKRDHDDRDRKGRNDRGRGRGRGGRGRGQGRGGRGDYNNRNNRRENVRTRYERQDESSDAAEIRRQVEFYFSDSNLPIDKYLLEETGGPENKPFPLKTIHNFKRMRHFQPFSAVVEAVKASDFLVVNDDDEVSRKEPLNGKFSLDVKKNSELLTSDSMLRSIYAKGFGEEKGSTAFDIEEFFAPYGVKSVRLRRHADGTFKGSVFVEFESEEAAQQFLEMDDKPKFEDNELKIMSKKEYVDMKTEGILDGSVKPRSPTRYGGGRGGSRGGRHNNRERRGSFNGYNKRKRDEDGEDNDVDKDNWRERRERFQRGSGDKSEEAQYESGRDMPKKDDDRSRSRSPYRTDKKQKRSASPEESKKESDAPVEVEGSAK